MPRPAKAVEVRRVVRQLGKKRICKWLLNLHFSVRKSFWMCSSFPSITSNQKLSNWPKCRHVVFYVCAYPLFPLGAARWFLGAAAHFLNDPGTRQSNVSHARRFIQINTALTVDLCVLIDCNYLDFAVLYFFIVFPIPKCTIIQEKGLL